MNWRNLLKNPDAIPVLALMRKDPDGQVLHDIAEKANWRLEFVGTYEAALQHIQRERYGVILCDRDSMPASDWGDAVQKLVAAAPGSCVILTSPVTNDRLWLELIEHGGYDVLTKPFQEEKVVRSVQFAWSHLRPGR